MSVECREKIVDEHKGSPIAAALLNHYDTHARTLAWRISPQQLAAGIRPDPYRVWLSEVMLQQTTVAAVTRYFNAFTTRWPTVEALAAASDEDVLAAWAGLGYYARARNLIACARAVAFDHGGRFPETEAELRQLPGVGDYTAAAVAAIAFGRPSAVVDANVERVTARLFAIQTPLPAARPVIREHVAQMLPADRPGDFAQSMMDVGATVCTPRNPSCLLCPVAGWCEGHANGMAESLPVKPPKKVKPQRTGTAFWIEQDGHVLLVQRAGKGMLGGMRALPDDGWSASRNGSAKAPFTGQWHIVEAAVSHVFTHFSLQLSLALYRGPQIDKVAIENLMVPLGGRSNGLMRQGCPRCSPRPRASPFSIDKAALGNGAIRQTGVEHVKGSQPGSKAQPPACAGLCRSARSFCGYAGLCPRDGDR